MFTASFSGPREAIAQTVLLPLGHRPPCLFACCAPYHGREIGKPHGPAQVVLRLGDAVGHVSGRELRHAQFAEERQHTGNPRGLFCRLRRGAGEVGEVAAVFPMVMKRRMLQSRPLWLAGSASRILETSISKVTSSATTRTSPAILRIMANPMSGSHFSRNASSFPILCLPQLRYDVFRVLSLFSHPLVLQIVGQDHPNWWTTSVGAFQPS